MTTPANSTVLLELALRAEAASGAGVNGVVPRATLSGWPSPNVGQRKAFDSIGQSEAEKHAADFHRMVVSLGKTPEPKPQDPQS